MAKKKKKPIVKDVFGVNKAFENIDLDEAMPEDQSKGLVEEDLTIARSNFIVDDFESFGSARFMVPQGQWRDLAERIEAQIRGLVYIIMNQGREGSCFPAGTLVRMADGSEKPIDEIRCTDSVLTAEGNIGRVVKTGVRKASGLFTLKVLGHRHLKMTEEHPVLTKRGYVRADSLKAGDMVRMPKYAPQDVKAIQTSEFLPAQKHATRELSRAAIIGGGVNSFRAVKHDVPDMIDLTEDFGWIVGLFLAEGSTSKQKVSWTLHVDERETVASELIRKLEGLGVTARIQDRSHAHGNSINVNVYSTKWARLFEGMCGTGSGRKCPQGDLLRGGKKFLQGMLDGWVAGDGYERRGRKLGTTVSKRLAMAMYDIAQFLGLCPTIRRSEPKATGSVRSRQVRWDIEWGSKPRCEIEDDAVWRKVVEVSREEWTGDVFNLEVEGDHSYVAEGIGVHNCVGYSTTQAVQVRSMFQYGPKYARLLSGMSLYNRIGRSAQSGAMMSDGAREAAEDGILPLDTADNRKLYKHVYRAHGFVGDRRMDREVPGWEETGALFKPTFLRINSFSAWMSATLQGMPIMYGRQGHAICSLLPKFSRGDWWLGYLNSWGKWGDTVNSKFPYGMGWDSRRVIQRCTGYACVNVTPRLAEMNIAA